ncbi:MAG: ADP-ribosylglycohydrolase family protein [Candidatus Kapabacteria bacterium]|nr:ADP-ribosylglycohydrolase family protein [Candidatus Kapabacteria bacterium]
MSSFPLLFGAIAGDIIGSIYESRSRNIKTTDFELLPRNLFYTDDTVLTVAIADCLLHKRDFSTTLRKYGRAFPGRGYGRGFKAWLASDEADPPNSYGNGSAMRASPIGFAYRTIEEVLDVAKASAEPTHNHPDGIKGAQAIASAVFLAYNGKSKEEIKSFIHESIEYDLNFTLDGIRDSYTFDVSCKGSVPQAIVAFLESTDYESAVRLAISIGGDSDTIASMAGAVAAAYYKEMPRKVVHYVKLTLPTQLLDIISAFDTLVKN